MKKSNLVLALAAFSFIGVFTNCKKDKNTEPETPTVVTPGPSGKKYALVISNGAQSIEVGKTIGYNAYLVSATGATVAAPGVTWSSNIGGISGANFTFNSDTVGLISASVEYEGVTYTSSVPINIQPVKSTQLFAVVPSAIVVPVGAEPIPLNTVYLGSGGASYNFTSANDNVASVSSAGLVTFKSAGNTSIKVSATINGQPSIMTIPVMVVGLPEVVLPVAKIVLTPALGEMFKGETLQLNAKAFDSNGKDVTGTVTFNYKVVPKLEEDQVPTIPVTVNGSGLVSAVSPGNAYIQVTSNGIMAQSEIIVNPDSVIMVTPFYVELGGFNPFTMQPNPTTQILTAKTYKVDRTAYRAGNSNFLNEISNPSDLKWELPETGIPQIDDVFKVVTLSNANSSNVTVTALQGKVGSSTVVAFSGDLGGAAAVMVMP